MGIALFGVIVLLFFLVQSGVFINGVIDRSPDLREQGFSFRLLDDPIMQERMATLMSNGDLIGQAALWSGLAGLLAILASVLLWKRSLTSQFLGLRIPAFKHFLIWAGVFILLGLIIEGLAYLSPVFRSDFMTDILGNTTNMVVLYLGVGVMAPFFEEFLLRGLLFGSVRHLADEHIAVAATAGVFTIMHMQYTPAVMLLILPLGVVLGYARAKSGSIWVPVALHMLNNLATVAFP